jgi:hypothetical protein
MAFVLTVMSLFQAIAIEGEMEGQDPDVGADLPYIEDTLGSLDHLWHKRAARNQSLG